MTELSETPFRLYAAHVVSGLQQEAELLVACDDCSVGDALLDIHKRGLLNGKRFGIMYRPVDDQPGEWLVNPWEKL